MLSTFCYSSWHEQNSKIISISVRCHILWHVHSNISVLRLVVITQVILYILLLATRGCPLSILSTSECSCSYRLAMEMGIVS